ncbi:hypothetical protein [Robiginitalea aurantiaca]|uniref:Uncharacterized protein n=1 Tax=Robiginitalea aurantiaca TaxID=3056915 RepID=A0ABT7WAV6_9FLAO|nr:hypothetical protein [Robiginitalea aurantiaca]MDM9630044.1 hypothetical protein [Robiginitalea aurantiaca]
MKNRIILLIALIFSGGIMFAQEAISGQIADWSNGNGDVIGGLRAPVILGSVASDGTFAIPLNADYLSVVKKQLEASKKESSSDFSTSLIKLDRAFGCSSENMEFTDTDQPVSALSTLGMFALGDMEQERLFGYLIAASSDEFAKSIKNIMSNEFKTGYFVDWYYVAKPASIKGSCTFESYAINQEEMYSNTQEYDLEFRAGWNIIKYEIEAVFEDRDGKTYPSRERYTVLDELPRDMKYVFLPHER